MNVVGLKNVIDLCKSIENLDVSFTKLKNLKKKNIHFRYAIINANLRS